ncbi:MAG: cystathionine gamma-synthase [Acidimicrobiales bacterium]
MSDTTDGFDTRAIHAGQEHEAITGAVITPIFQTSTYAQPSPGDHTGYEYSRTDNPTRTALQAALADLEDARFGYSFASGMAAEDTVLRSLSAGDHVVRGNDVYGGTFRLISNVVTRAGVTWSAADLTDPSALSDNWNPATRIVWMETPTNPLLTVFSISAIAEVAHANGAKLVVDNTFASPYLQQPIAHGADLVIHSTTKYVGGHSDTVGGFAATNDEEWASDIKYLQNAVGAVPAPMDCFLTHRGLKTLGVRMDRHCSNAEQVVEMLLAHPKVSTVLYPTLDTNPGAAIAKEQMKAGGGMISFRVHGGIEAAKAVTTKTRLFTLAESLGGIESLIEHPGVMTHASAAGSPLEVPDDLVRLSVGIETADDLVADLNEALDGV